MKQYSHHFLTETDFETYINTDYTQPFLSATNKPEGGFKVDYNLGDSRFEAMKDTPLTLKFYSGGNLTMKIYGDSASTTDTRNIEYSKNGGEWVAVTITMTPWDLSCSNGDVVEIRGTNNGMGINNGNMASFSGSTGVFSVYGNVMSLINKDTYPTLTTIPIAYCFRSLFVYTPGIISCEFLYTPKTLKNYCYYNMFYGCPNLKKAMYKLPATSLTTYCYRAMFSYCDKLETAPFLPALSPVANSYYYMFRNSPKVNYIKCLATGETVSTSWVAGVSSTGTFVKHPDSILGFGSNAIPTGWKVEDAVL